MGTLFFAACLGGFESCGGWGGEMKIGGFHENSVSTLTRALATRCEARFAGPCAASLAWGVGLWILWWVAASCVWFFTSLDCDCSSTFSEGVWS